MHHADFSATILYEIIGQLGDNYSTEVNTLLAVFGSVIRIHDSWKLVRITKIVHSVPYPEPSDYYKLNYKQMKRVLEFNFKETTKMVEQVLLGIFFFLIFLRLEFEL